MIALPSSGLHSNGYSLARKALLAPEHGNLDLADPLPGARVSVGEALLEPTRIYAPAFTALRALAGEPVHAAAHITGGGLLENPPRALSETLAMRIDLDAIELPPILAAIAALDVPRDELLRTFNCGVGMLLIVDRDRVDEVLAACEGAGQPGVVLGDVFDRAGSDATQVEISGGPG